MRLSQDKTMLHVNPSLTLGGIPPKTFHYRLGNRSALEWAVATLIEDLFDRGLHKRVMVMVTGEFGRTPRIKYQPDSGSGVTQPGRDHWPRATSLLFAGGDARAGQVIGATDKHGSNVIDRRVGVRDILASLYHHLGINAEHTGITDRTGRPVPVLPEGAPIPELIAS
jgi:Protein of unknown function (DUF1501)